MLAVGVLFFRVIEPFIVPLFIAVVLAVLFEPMYERLAHWLGGKRRIAAAIATLCVVLLLVVPVGGVLLMASNQLAAAAQHAVSWFERFDRGDLEGTLQEMDGHPLGRRLDQLYQRLPVGQQKQLRQATANVSDGVASEIYDKTRGMLGNLFDAVVGFAIMGLGLFYFLVDKRSFLNELHRLLPLERGEERQLFQQFQRVCRGVVLGTVVAGLAQAALAGVAFAVLGIEQLWLLVVLTMFCSFIPFVGSVTVWAPVAVTLFMADRTTEAIGLTIFGALVISTVDNLIRAYVIGGEAQLHPLIALVSVLGALKLIGLWGIFIGPMIAAFFYALTQILRNRLAHARPAQENQTAQ